MAGSFVHSRVFPTAPCPVSPGQPGRTAVLDEFAHKADIQVAVLKSPRYRMEFEVLNLYAHTLAGGFVVSTRPRPRATSGPLSGDTGGNDELVGYPCTARTEDL